MKAKKAEKTETADLAAVLEHLRADPAFMRCVSRWERLPARPARFAPWPSQLDPRVVAAARARGADAPFTHQAQAMQALLEGENVVLSTAAASGKTLAYNLPVLHTLLNDPAACALYLFPTKALAHDQIAALSELVGALQAPIPVRPYDGDTPTSHRTTIRREARILVSNPDMLHTGILPHHTRWARFFGSLRYVVLDELHVYRGIFGSHVANVLRRLQRVCRFYGSAPRFVCASATIANPRELAERLLEQPATLVDDDGAPRGEKHFVLYNPPLLDAQLGIRRSAILEASDIAARFLRQNAQTIVFARARRTTEVLLGYLRDRVAGDSGDPSAVRGYRGGYLPTLRREIERGLRQGQVRGVVTTNALELGIDIGELSACVLAGYPGTVASTWQQAGRAGRRAGVSIAVLVASAQPLDQFMVAHPDYFFGRSPEHALIAPDNLALLASHLQSASFELPFGAGESLGRCAVSGELLAVLAEEGLLHRSGAEYRWIGDGYPAQGVSLRTGTSENVVIQLGAAGRPEDDAAGAPLVIGQIDRPSAPGLLHPGAVYLHEGQTYLVDALDWERGLAHVSAAELDYYTQPSATTNVQVIEVRSPPASEGDAPIHAYGDVLVTTRVSGFRTIKRYSHETLAWTELDLPEQTLNTAAYWLALPDALVTQLEDSGVSLRPRDYGPNWQQQRAAALARDGRVCRHCGTPELPGRPLEVHHLTPLRDFGYRPGLNQAYLQANALDNLITLCASCHRQVERARGARSALGGLGYLLRNLAPLHLMCDPGDLGSAVQSRAPDTGLPTVLIYEQVPGGVGLSMELFERHDDLLRAASDLVRGCPCSEGCPSCVGPVGESEPGAKGLTQKLLEAVRS